MYEFDFKLIKPINEGSNDNAIVEIDGKPRYWKSNEVKGGGYISSERLLAQAFVSHLGSKECCNFNTVKSKLAHAKAYGRKIFGIVSEDFGEETCEKKTAAELLQKYYEHEIKEAEENGDGKRVLELTAKKEDINSSTIPDIVKSIQHYARQNKKEADGNLIQAGRELSDEELLNLRGDLLMEAALQVLIKDRDVHSCNIEFFCPGPQSENQTYRKTCIFDSEQSFDIAFALVDYRLNVTDASFGKNPAEMQRMQVAKDLVAEMERFREDCLQKGIEDPRLKAYDKLLELKAEEELIATFNKNFEVKNEGEKITNTYIKKINGEAELRAGMDEKTVLTMIDVFSEQQKLIKRQQALFKAHKNLKGLNDAYEGGVTALMEIIENPELSAIEKEKLMVDNAWAARQAALTAQVNICKLVAEMSQSGKNAEEIQSIIDMVAEDSKMLALGKITINAAEFNPDKPEAGNISVTIGGETFRLADMTEADWKLEREIKPNELTEEQYIICAHDPSIEAADKEKIAENASSKAKEAIASGDPLFSISEQDNPGQVREKTEDKSEQESAPVQVLDKK